jgi:hypothetical protein
MMSDPAGLSVHVAGYVWTILSPWRIPLAILSVMLLALSAARLWRGTPNARVLALATLWGVLLPQVVWYPELVVDWYQGQIGTVLAYGLFAVLMPTALLYDGAQTLGGWGAQVSRARLFATATLLGWIAFLGTNLLDHRSDDLANIPTVAQSLDGSLRALEEDHDFLPQGDVFTPDVIETWLASKYENDVDPVRMRPHPYEFHLYFDV